MQLYFVFRITTFDYTVTADYNAFAAEFSYDLLSELVPLTIR